MPAAMECSWQTIRYSLSVDRTKCLPISLFVPISFPGRSFPRKSRWQLQLPNAVFRRPWRRHGSSTWHGTTNRPNGPEIAIIRLKATAVVCCRSASVFIETDLTKKFLEEIYYSSSTMDLAFRRAYTILIYETQLTKRRNVRVSMFPSRRSESVMRQGAIHIH